MNKSYERLQDCKNLISELESFNSYEWTAFIQAVILDKKGIRSAFKIPADEETIVYILSFLRKLNDDTHRLIAEEIESWLSMLLKDFAKDIFYIVYTTPIRLYCPELLKILATNESLNFDSRFDAASILAYQNNISDLEWWHNLVKTKDGLLLASIALDEMLEQSLELALQFLCELDSLGEVSQLTDNLDYFMLSLRMLLEKILESEPEKVHFFPNWTKSIIGDLCKFDKFKILKIEFINKVQSHNIDIVIEKLKDLCKFVDESSNDLNSDKAMDDWIIEINNKLQDLMSLISENSTKKITKKPFPRLSLLSFKNKLYL